MAQLGHSKLRLPAGSWRGRSSSRDCPARRAHAGVFMTQWPVFVASAWLAANALQARRTRLIAFASLAANPLLVVYSAQAFTESVTLSCVLFATAALARAARAGAGPRSAAWLVAGAAVSSYAVAVRPGSLLVQFATRWPRASSCSSRRTGRRSRSRLRRVQRAAAALVLPLLPQVVINHRHYHSSSPLPRTTSRNYRPRRA